MPLSFGIPLGILVMLIGTVLFYVTKHKRIATVVISIGAFIAAFTLILIVLVLDSSM
jgi:hypothetical protein